MEPIHNKDLLALPLTASANSELLAAVGSDGLVLIHTSDRSSYKTQSGPISPVSAVTFSQDGNLLATEGADARLRVWDLVEGKLKTSLQTEFMTHAAFSADGRWAAYFNARERLTLHDVMNGTETVTRFSHPSFITPTVRLSPDGKWAAWNDPRLKLWNVGSASKPIALCPNPGPGIAAFSSDSKQIAAICDDHEQKHVMVWKLSDPTDVQILSAEFREPQTLVFGRQGTLGLNDLEHIIIWDLNLKKVRPVLNSKAGEYFISFAFGGNQDQFVITAGSGKNLENLKIWDSKTGIVVRSLLGHISEVAAVAESPDGLWVASGGEDGTTRIWDPATGHEVAVLISVYPFNGISDQWIALTRKGFFDGSADAMKWVSWLERSSSEMFPLDCFFESFYSPGLLSDLFARVPVGKNFDIADKLRIPAFRSLFSQGLITLHQRQNKVFLCMPETPNTDILQGIELRGRNDEIILAPKDFVRNDESAECAYERELPFPLRDVELAAKNFSAPTRTTTRWDHVPADFEKEKQSKSTLYVQTFGIDAYPDGSGYPSLTYARSDAEAIEKSFFTHANSIYDKVDVGEGLYDGAATRDAIRSRLSEMSKKVNANDVVVLFFSGHGSVPSGQEMFYFIPADISAKSPDQERESALSTAMISEALRDFKARRIILIIDACQAGGALDSLAHVAKIKLAIEERITKRSPANSSLGPAGVYVLAAATPFREAAAPGVYEHGLLTEAVLEVLGGSDDPRNTTSASEKVSAKDLNERLGAALKRLGANASYNQTPLTFGMGADIPLACNACQAVH